MSDAPIVIESRRKSMATLERNYPGALIVDVTSKSADTSWVRFSPFYPHGKIPIPGSPGHFAQSVEGIWQGLKVFANQDIDPSKFAIKDMKGIKRTARSLGAVKGHRFGIGSDVLLGYREARIKIYLPAYSWILENRLCDELLALEKMGRQIVLLDYETNCDIDNLSKPLSHASLIKRNLEYDWPEF